MAFYWHDSREGHGTGRRYLQPEGELSKGLGGQYGNDIPGSAAVGKPLGAKAQGGYNTGYLGAIYGDSSPSARGPSARGPPPAAPVVEARQASFQEPAPAVASTPLRSEAGREGGKPPSVAGSGAGGRAEAAAVAADCGPLEVMQPSLTVDTDPAEYPGLQGSVGGGRRHFEAYGHMQDAGTSAPDVGRHGRGRRYFEPEDHEVIKQEEDASSGGARPPVDDYFKKPSGRRNIPVADTIKTHLRTPLQENELSKVPSTVEMKDAIKEWLTTAHNMAVVDEALWNDVVELKPRGCHWVVEAICPKRKTLSREGPNARFIAEKLSMMSVQDLRHFGLRFGGDYQPVKTTALETNRSLVSLGMHAAMGDDVNEGLSSLQTYPSDAVQRRYIASGKDNFIACAQPSGHSPGHARDTDFANGIERGIGHGKRYIGSQDHMPSVLYTR